MPHLRALRFVGPVEFEKICRRLFLSRRGHKFPKLEELRQGIGLAPKLRNSFRERLRQNRFGKISQSAHWALLADAVDNDNGLFHRVPPEQRMLYQRRDTSRNKQTLLHKQFRRLAES